MQDNGSKFKLILLGVFILLALFGLLALITYRSKSKAKVAIVPLEIWGTMPGSVFDSFLRRLETDTKTELKISYTERSPDTIYNDTIEAIASGASPDVLLITQDLIGTFSSKINSVPFANFPKTDFMNTFVQGTEVYLGGSGIVAIPFAIDPLMLYWNREMYANAGIANPPKTWAEFPNLAEKLTIDDTDSKIKQSAVAFGDYSNIRNAKALLSTLFLQAGNPIVVSSYDGYVSAIGDNKSPSIYESLNFYTEYSNPKKIVYSWNSSMPDSRKAFLGDQLATYFGFGSEKKVLRSLNPNLNFDVAAMPQILDAKNKAVFGNIYGFTFLKSSTKYSSALPRIFLLISPEYAKVFDDVSDYAPVRRDIIGAGPSDPAKKIYFDEALIAKTFHDANPSGSDQVFKQLIDDITSGRSNINQSIGNAKKAFDNLL